MSFFLIISIFKVEYLENGLADFTDFGLILQDFGRPFSWSQLVLALQFSFKCRTLQWRTKMSTYSLGDIEPFDFQDDWHGYTERVQQLFVVNKITDEKQMVAT